MNDALDLLIYLDEALTKNLNSLVIDGFIEKRTSRFIEDRTLNAKTGSEGSNQHYGEDRCIRDERDGYKGKNFTEADTVTTANRENQSLEGRRFVRREEELTRIFTTFEIHQQLIQGLNQSNLIKELDSSSYSTSNINSGDYVKLSGQISSESMVSYIDSLSNLLSCLGTDNLNSYCQTLKSTNSSFVNYDIMYKQVNYLKSLLTTNNSQDMIVKCGNMDVVLTVNNSNFISNYANIYDSADCPCTIIGKVIRKCDSAECIHLLRKSGQPNFYENFLGCCSPLMDNISNLGIYLPDQPRFRVPGESLLLIPISMLI
ncbi:hypothetical protein [Clostridium sp.]|uniref:DUF6414 family protein n=1 Tax=Clostridium sp. TaxID=1506 RepID=UPI0025BF8A6E|nr:hypothetical protein [Clostridium sp.]MBS4955543.1 hypothetical protein [Clostridium sp.]MDU4882267.1 hypothetical protein [Clostridium celatum]MDU7075537.1 hypothetical protein [Clostridium celatum]